MIVGSSQLWKKYYCAAFLKQMPDFTSLLSATSDTVNTPNRLAKFVRLGFEFDV
jgi:hypothetical protein